MSESENAYNIIAPDSPLGRDFERSYQVNLETLNRHQQETAGILEQVDFQNEWGVFVDTEYRYGVFRKGNGISAQWKMLTDFDTIPRRQQQFAGLMEEYRRFILFRAGIGELLLVLADTLQDKRHAFHRNLPEIWVIEPIPSLFKAILFFMDLHDLWKWKQLTLFSGPEWESKVLSGLNSWKKKNEKILLINQAEAENTSDYQTFIKLIEKVDLQNVDVWNEDKVAPLRKTSGSSQASDIEMFLLDDSAPRVFKQCYRNNLALLKGYPYLLGRGDVMAEIENAVPSIGLQSNGQMIFQSRSDPHKHYVLSVPEKEVESSKKLLTRNTTVEDTCLIVGTGGGQFIRLVLETTVFKGQWAGYEMIVYLIEENVELFKAFLHLVDIADAVSRKRLRMFVGPDAVDTFDNYLRGDGQARIPSKFFTLSLTTGDGGPDIYAKIRKNLDQLRREREGEILEIVAELEEYYAGRSLEQWRSRFHSGESLRVAGVTSVMTSFLQYCMRDLIKGFQEMGYDAILVTDRDPLSSLDMLQVLKTINRLKPDIIVNIDHVRESLKFLPPSLPYVCWIQDLLPHLLGENVNFQITDWDFVYVISKPWIKDLKKRNSRFRNREIKTLAVGINTDIYHSLGEVRKKYDVVFITHMFAPETTLLPYRETGYAVHVNNIEKQLIETGKVDKNVLETLYREMAQSLDRMGLAELTALLIDLPSQLAYFESLFDRLGMPRDEYLVDHWRQHSSRFWKDLIMQIKWRPIEYLRKNKVKVATWGNNWGKLPGMEKVGQGIAANGEKINRIQNQAKICLNNSGGISMHMRSMEIMGSKAFMLSRKIENDGFPLTDYFQEGKEVVLFNDEQDLLKKIRYYLEQNTEREKIAAAAHVKLLNLFSYRNIADKIVKDIRHRFDTMSEENMGTLQENINETSSISKQ